MTPTTIGVTGIVMGNITRLWQKHAAIGAVNPKLRDLYVQRDGADLVIAILESKVDFSTGSDGFSIRLSQRLAARQKQREAIQAEIERVEAQSMQTSAPAIGLITTTSPIAVPVPGSLPTPVAFSPDANSPIYSGSPYWRPSR